jgi:chromosome partitioning protein
MSNLDVKIADLDIQQATSINWVRRRLENDIQPSISVEPFKTSEQAIKTAVNHELFIIDVPARASKGTYEISKYSEKHAVSSDSERLCFQFGN